ncbi:MAG: diadenylate cyclase CdaA [Oscillospiraceae bacterium]|nr:diadenylate cyclase CdaA [Oscillospiraceae bacterium]
MSVIAHYANLCLGYIQTIKITDVIDMAIIAYAIYRLLLLVRKSRTGQVLRGVLLLLAALWISYEAHLHVLSFILSKAIEIGFLAIIVLFQPEIRRALEQVGSRGFDRLLGRQSKVTELERTITETVDAFGTMSRDRVGALVVFERDTILDDCVKSGTLVNADISSELLKNIFWPKAPLHDGAVIVRSGRLLSAGCVLPLTGNNNISRELGTRHRAGIGVSEHSDAVVAIVSEETGAISVAVDGMLKRHLSLETLERLLRNELIGSEAQEEKKRFTWGGLLRRRKEGDEHVE